MVRRGILSEGSDMLGRRFVKQNKFEMGLKKSGDVARFKNLKFREKLVKDLQKLQSQIDSGIATIHNYSNSLSKIASDFHYYYVYATDIMGLSDISEIKSFIDRVLGDVVDDSYIENDDVLFNIIIETRGELDLGTKIILENSTGFSHNEKVDVSVEIINDTIICLVVKINR